MNAITDPTKLDLEWTPQQVERLTELWTLGWTCRAIAADIGTTPSAITGKRIRLNLPGRPDPLKNHYLYHPKKPVAELPYLFRRRRANTPDPELPLEPVSPNPLMLTIAELTASTCRWPIGEPRQPGFGFCGHTTEHTDDGHRTYCPFHRTISARVSVSERSEKQYSRPDVQQYFSKLNYS